MTAYLTAAALTALALPDLPSTDRAIQLRAARENWPFRKRSGRGGGREYEVQALLRRLPRASREKLIDHLSRRAVPPLVPAAAPAGGSPIVPAPAGVPVGQVEVIGDTTALTNSQRAIMDARCAILAYVDRLAEVTGGITQARHEVERQARMGLLPSDLARLVPLANAKAGRAGKGAICLRTLINWHSARAAAAGQAAALAPKVPQPDYGIPPWAPALLAKLRQPQKRGLHRVVTEDLVEPGVLPPGVAPPSYDQVKRWLAKVSTIERNRGRMGPRALRAIQPFVKRTTENLQPLDAVQADGHTFDAEVEHPIHHRALKPEMTTIIDLATRMLVGWSASLSESFLSVSDAIIYMATRHGPPAVWYIDNGSGYNNQLMSAANTGLLDRLGVAKLNRRAKNPQAGGYVERVHQTLWVDAARKLPTYIGRDMDKEASERAHKITRADLKKFGRSRLLMPWTEFIAFAQASVDAYNRRPHRALPRITDPVSGRRRHMTPSEMWDKFVDEGWRPVTLSPAEAADLSRPHEECPVKRGTVRLLGHTYKAPELDDWHDDIVQVAFDINDPSRVWVKDSDGRLICEAPLERSVDVVPLSFVEKGRVRRAKAREARLMNHLAEIRAELDPRTIDAGPAPLPDNVAALHQRLVVEMTAPPDDISAMPETADGRYARWQRIDVDLAEGRPVADPDRAWHARYPKSAEWKAADQIRRSFAADAARAG